MRPSSSVGTLASCALALGLAAASFSGCAPIDPSADPEAIVGGTRETGYRSVFFMYRLDGSACTSALISPRVVLTARHCVAQGTGTIAPSQIRVYAGTDPSSFYAEYRVASVRIIPGSTPDIGDGLAQDLALMVLTAPATEMPIGLARDLAPGNLTGRNATAIGFGQTPSGSSGTKLRVTAHVNGVEAGLLFVDPAVCPGDSGGPLIGEDGLIYGVASFIFSPDGRSEPACGTAPGAYNEIFRHLSWIDGVLEEVGDVCTPADEVCDGRDNDCDGVADEPCLPLGAACTTNEECTGGLCDDTAVGRICTTVCDPRVEGACAEGSFCALRGCDGRCVPGTPGGGGVGAACSADVECGSGYCRDPGDGHRRCLAACRADAGECLADEVCVPLEGSACGGCVSSSIVGGARGLGEPCASDAECRSGLCRDGGGTLVCVEPCDPAFGNCSAGHLCTDGACVPDRRQPVGGPCRENADCLAGLCAALGDRHWCTAPCGSDSMCPSGFLCDPSARVCAPMGALAGESCAGGAGCSNGLCAGVEGGAVCVSVCDASAPCGAGFACRRTADGTAAVCVAIGHGGGGCAVVEGGAGAGRRGARGTLLVAGLLGLLLARRRAR